MSQRSAVSTVVSKPPKADRSAAATAPLALAVNARRVVGTLLGTAAFLVVAGLISTLLQLYAPEFFGRDLFIGLFYLNAESNIPATFSALLLFLAALILGVIAYAQQRLQNAQAFSWKALAFIFCYLAVDEAAMLHERTADFVRTVMPTNGILHFAWVVPYGILTVIVGLSFVRFLTQLPAQTRNQIVVAGFIYVMGALGFELIEGLVVSTQGTENLPNQLLNVVEDGSEMLGVILFIRALLGYIQLYLPNFKLQLGLTPAAPSAAQPGSRD